MSLVLSPPNLDVARWMPADAHRRRGRIEVQIETTVEGGDPQLRTDLTALRSLSWGYDDDTTARGVLTADAEAVITLAAGDGPPGETGRWRARRIGSRWPGAVEARTYRVLASETIDPEAPLSLYWLADHAATTSVPLGGTSDWSDWQALPDPTTPGHTWRTVWVYTFHPFTGRSEDIFELTDSSSWWTYEASP